MGNILVNWKKRIFGILEGIDLCEIFTCNVKYLHAPV